MIGNDWVTPLDFWKLPPGQLWWIIDAKLPERARNRGPDMMEIRRMVKAEKAKERESV
jgi:hypothetical protein